MRSWLLGMVGLVLLAPAVIAGGPELLDPRLYPQTIQALQAALVLREAEIGILKEHLTKRETEWGEYSKPLWAKDSGRKDNK